MFSRELVRTVVTTLHPGNVMTKMRSSIKVILKVYLTSPIRLPREKCAVIQKLNTASLTSLTELENALLGTVDYRQDRGVTVTTVTKTGPSKVVPTD